MSKLIFQNAAFVNTDTFPTCIKLAPEDNYVDTIYRNTVYTGQAPKIIRVKNSCVTPFTLPVQTLFTDSINGGNFVATTVSTNIPANSTVDVPVGYTGTYKGTSNNPSYTITINGTNATYVLTILTPDTAPVTYDKTIALANRVGTVITKSSLSFTDADGDDTVDGVRFTGDVSKLFIDSGYVTPYVSGTELTMNTFALYYKAPSQDAASTYQVDYNVKANGVWSV